MSTTSIADRLATIAHASQKRRDGSSYIRHPRRVALRVANLMQDVIARGGFDKHHSLIEYARQAALLHDVIEDTKVKLNDLIIFGFDTEVIEAVKTLTKLPDEAYDAYITRILTAPGRWGTIARFVKYADITDNRMDDPTTKQEERYLEAQDQLVSAMRRNGEI
jgi:hypothetical protein